MSPGWYSARLRLACLVEGKGAVQFCDSVVMLRAGSFLEAFGQALQAGRRQEEEYSNAAGQQVVWRLKEITTLDFVSDGDLDGAEVYSEPVELGAGETYRFDVVFRPEASETSQTL